MGGVFRVRVQVCQREVKTGTVGMGALQAYLTHSQLIQLCSDCLSVDHVFGLMLPNVQGKLGG